MCTKFQIENIIKKKICGLKVVYLCQKDFKTPFIIDKPGHYILKENIKLNFFPKKKDSLIIFDFCHDNGVNFEGPAPRPLERYRIVLANDGQILVDKTKNFKYEKGEWSRAESFLKV